MKPSVLRPSGGGWEHSIGDEIVFTVCRKLITRNKLISRYSFRINCIFTEVTASDGSSSSDKGWTHKGGGWHGGEGGLLNYEAYRRHFFNFWLHLIIPSEWSQTLICCRFNCRKGIFVTFACSICWCSCPSHMAQCTWTARPLFYTMWL